MQGHGFRFLVFSARGVHERDGMIGRELLHERQLDVRGDRLAVQLAQQRGRVDAHTHGVSRGGDVDRVHDAHTGHDVRFKRREGRFQKRHARHYRDSHAARRRFVAKQLHRVLRDARVPRDGVHDASLPFVLPHDDFVVAVLQHEAGEGVAGFARRAAHIRHRGSRHRLRDGQELLRDGGVDVLQHLGALVDVVEGGQRDVRGQALQRGVPRRAHVHARAGRGEHVPRLHRDLGRVARPEAHDDDLGREAFVVPVRGRRGARVGGRARRPSARESRAASPGASPQTRRRSPRPRHRQSRRRHDDMSARRR